MCLSDYNIKDRSRLDVLARMKGGKPDRELLIPIAVVLQELSDMFSMVIQEGSQRNIMISKAHFSLFMSVFVFEQTKKYNGFCFYNQSTRGIKKFVH